MTTRDEAVFPPRAPHVLALTMESPILNRTMQLVYAEAGLAYRQFTLGDEGNARWSVYTARDYIETDGYPIAMTSFFTRLDAAGWQMARDNAVFIFEAEPEWLTSLSKKRVDHKISDAFAKFAVRFATGATEVDTTAGSVVE